MEASLNQCQLKFGRQLNLAVTSLKFEFYRELIPRFGASGLTISDWENDAALAVNRGCSASIGVTIDRDAKRCAAICA